MPASRRACQAHKQTASKGALRGRYGPVEVCGIKRQVAPTGCFKATVPALAYVNRSVLFPLCECPDQGSRERVSIANGPPIFTATVHATSGCQAMQRIYLGIVFLSVTGLVFLALVSLDRLIGQ